MMKLLTAYSLTVRDTFQPESMALNLSERQSTATVTVGPAAPEIAVGDWIQDDTDPGKGIVWRVKTVDTQYDTNTRTIQLEHMIMFLKDRLMFGEVTPSTMGGGDSCTARQAVEYIQEHFPASVHRDTILDFIRGSKRGIIPKPRNNR